MGEQDNAEPAPTAAAPATVGVVGAGTMGIGVAQCFMEAGHPVVVVDPDPDALGSGPERLRAGMKLARMLGRRPRRAGDTAAAPVTWSAELADLSDALFVVECAVEKEPVKELVLRELDAVCGPETVFASCTSCIPVTRLGSFTSRPDRVIGTHFMNPAPLKDTVEVIRAPGTSEDTVRRTEEFLAGIGKHGVVVRDAPGFVTNRVLMLTLNEAAAVLDEGTADAATVDQIFQECFGHPMGPLRTADLIGLDTVVDSLDVLREHTGDDRFRPTPLLARLVAQGRTGRKTGGGFYPYPEPGTQIPAPTHAQRVPQGETSHG